MRILGMLRVHCIFLVVFNIITLNPKDIKLVFLILRSETIAICSSSLGAVEADIHYTPLSILHRSYFSIKLL